MWKIQLTCVFKIIYILEYSVDPSLSKGVDYFEKLSKHKFLLPIYDLVPRIGHCWIAPNATIGRNIF
jgi:hypothetical protein